MYILQRTPSNRPWSAIEAGRLRSPDSVPRLCDIKGLRCGIVHCIREDGETELQIFANLFLAEIGEINRLPRGKIEIGFFEILGPFVAEHLRAELDGPDNLA